MGRAGSFQKGVKHQNPQKEQSEQSPAAPNLASISLTPSVLPNFSSQLQQCLYLEQEG